jgi:hypothetical protein
LDQNEEICTERNSPRPGTPSKTRGNFGNSANFKERVLTPKSNRDQKSFAQKATKKNQKQASHVGKENPSRKTKIAKQKQPLHTVATPSTSYAKALNLATKQPSEPVPADVATTPTLPEAVECKVRPKLLDPAHSVATPSTSFLQALVGKENRKKARLTSGKSLIEQAARGRHKRRESTELEIKLQERLQILRDDGCEGVTPPTDPAFHTTWDVQTELKEYMQGNNVQNKARVFAGTSTPVPIQEGNGKAPDVQMVQHSSTPSTWDIEGDLMDSGVDVGSIAQTFSEHTTVVGPNLAPEMLRQTTKQCVTIAPTDVEQGPMTVIAAVTKIQTQVRIMVARQTFFRAALLRENGHASADSGSTDLNDSDNEGRYMFDERLCQFVLCTGNKSAVAGGGNAGGGNARGSSAGGSSAAITDRVDTDCEDDDDDDDIEYEQAWDECFYEVDRTFEALDNEVVEETPLAKPTSTTDRMSSPVKSPSSTYLSYPWLWYFPSCELVQEKQAKEAPSPCPSTDSAFCEIEGEKVEVIADNYCFRIEKLIAEDRQDRFQTPGDGLGTPVAPITAWDCTPPVGIGAGSAILEVTPISDHAACGWEHSVKVVAVESGAKRYTPSPLRRLAECNAFSDDESDGESPLKV